jgi:hypothetical protein
MKPLDGGVAALSAPDAAPELRLVAFQDRPGTASRRGRSAEEQAAFFYLEHRSPRRRSATDPARLLEFGQAVATCDVEGSCEVIRRSLDATVPPAWRGPVLLALGWSLSPGAIRDPAPDDGLGPWLVRIGFPFEPPEGLCRRALVAHARTWRGALLSQHIAKGVDVDALPASPVASEPWLVGVGPIASHLQCSQRHVARLIERGLPVFQLGPGCQVRALGSELDAWIRSCPWAGPAKVGSGS